MAEPLHHAFLDESGGVAVFVPDDRFLVVAILVTRSPRAVEIVIRQARKRFRSGLTSIDSTRVRGLQAVDYVAWALWQKYQRGNDDYYQIIKDKVVVEEIIEVETK